MTISWLAGPPALGTVALALWFYAPDKPRDALAAAYPGDYRIVDGIRLRLRDNGPHDAPAVILLHGFGASLDTWEPWAQALSARYRVIRFDLPGFGLTGPDPTGDYSDARETKILTGLMDQLGIVRASLVGHSLGGRIVSDFAALHSDRVTRLVLVSPDGFAWKFSDADLKERKFWKDYAKAYEECIEATSTDAAPWYVVPADDKENARLIVSRILLDTFEDLDMRYPKTGAKRERELQKFRSELSEPRRELNFFQTFHREQPPLAAVRKSAMKDLVIFDLDGTLAPSKSSLDEEMAGLLGRLLGIVKVAIISGGALAQFEKQVLAFLPHDERLNGLSLLPTCGTQFYRFDGAWKKLYSEDFSATEKTTIIAAFNRAVDQAGLRAKIHWGDLIEDRDSQITFSALGQQAPLPDKQGWDPDFAKRKIIEGILAPMIPGFSIRLGGATSIDVTRPGIDKGYGVRKLRDTLGIALKDMIFVGDAIFPGGNDYPAKQAGVESIRVRDPQETKRVIEAICACLET